MAEVVYKINVDVNGAPSGSDQLANEQGQPLTDKKKKPKKPKKVTALSLFEDKVGKKNFKRIKNTVGFTSAVSVAGLSIYTQNAKFKGDSNTVARIGEVTTWGGRALATGGLLATGNYLGAGIYVAYTAFSLAKENRELINTRITDEFQSNYYQQRLVYDVSKRSR